MFIYIELQHLIYVTEKNAEIMDLESDEGCGNTVADAGVKVEGKKQEKSDDDDEESNRGCR